MGTPTGSCTTGSAHLSTAKPAQFPSCPRERVQGHTSRPAAGRKTEIDQPHIKRAGHRKPGRSPPAQRMRPGETGGFYDVPGSFSPIHDIKSSRCSAATRRQMLDLSVRGPQAAPVVLPLYHTPAGTSVQRVLPFSLPCFPGDRDDGRVPLRYNRGNNRETGLLVPKADILTTVDRRGGPP